MAVYDKAYETAREAQGEPRIQGIPKGQTGPSGKRVCNRDPQEIQAAAVHGSNGLDGWKRA